MAKGQQTREGGILKATPNWNRRETASKKGIRRKNNKQNIQEICRRNPVQLEAPGLKLYAPVRVVLLCFPGPLDAAVQSQPCGREIQCGDVVVRISSMEYPGPVRSLDHLPFLQDPV